MVFLVLCDFFGQIHSTSLNFSLQIGLWTKKRLVFVFVSILMTMSYMSLEIFSFEWIQILNGTKVWQYHRLSHHKIWATSIHIWFFEFHTTVDNDDIKGNHGKKDVNEIENESTIPTGFKDIHQDHQHEVWNHFYLNKPLKLVQCKHCSSIMKIFGNIMKSHLDTCDKVPQ